MKQKLTIILSCIVILVTVASNLIGLKLNAKIKNENDQLKKENEILNKTIQVLREENAELKEASLEVNKEVPLPEEKDNDDTEEKNTMKTYTVSFSQGVNVREKPSTDSSIIKVLDYKTVFEGEEVETETGVWVKMENGYVCSVMSNGQTLVEETTGE